MKLYRVNQLSAVNGRIVKKIDILASDDRHALRAVAARDDCPICEVWREGVKIGSIE